jgi:hypothetical protein
MQETDSTSHLDKTSIIVMIDKFFNKEQYIHNFDRIKDNELSIRIRFYIKHPRHIANMFLLIESLDVSTDRGLSIVVTRKQGADQLSYPDQPSYFMNITNGEVKVPHVSESIIYVKNKTSNKIDTNPTSKISFINQPLTSNWPSPIKFSIDSLFVAAQPINPGIQIKHECKPFNPLDLLSKVTQLEKDYALLKALVDKLVD